MPGAASYERTDRQAADPRGDLQRLTATRDQHELGPAWNAAGSRIAFWRTPAPFGPGSIWTMTANGTDERRLTVGIDARDPAWSPAGTRIAFTLASGEGFDVWTMRASDGADLQQVTSGPALDFEPAWSPDGTRLVFERDSGPSFSIYTVNVDGTGLTRVTDGPYFDTGPAFSPDGRFIAFGSNRGGTFLDDLWIVNADGTELRRVRELRFSESFSDWRP